MSPSERQLFHCKPAGCVDGQHRENATLVGSAGPLFLSAPLARRQSVGAGGGTVWGRGYSGLDWQRDTTTRLTFTQTNLYPVWTPDGKHIVFEAQSLGANSIRCIRADGAGEAQPLL